MMKIIITSRVKKFPNSSKRSSSLDFVQLKYTSRYLRFGKYIWTKFRRNLASFESINNSRFPRPSNSCKIYHDCQKIDLKVATARSMPSPPCWMFCNIPRWPSRASIDPRAPLILSKGPESSRSIQNQTTKWWGELFYFSINTYKHHLMDLMVDSRESWYEHLRQIKKHQHLVTLWQFCGFFPQKQRDKNKLEIRNNCHFSSPHWT